MSGFRHPCRLLVGNIGVRLAGEIESGAMPEVSRFFGIVIRMYFNDHNPAHFHAEYGEHEALLEIETLAVLGADSGTVPKPDPVAPAGLAPDAARRDTRRSPKPAPRELSLPLHTEPAASLAWPRREPVESGSVCGSALCGSAWCAWRPRSTVASFSSCRHGDTRPASYPGTARGSACPSHQRTRSASSPRWPPHALGYFFI